MDSAFRRLSITSEDTSLTPNDLLLFKPKILQAIDRLREKKKRPDVQSIYDLINKSEASNIDRKS